MTKAQRMIEEHMKQVDAVCEILDARIPMASRNPDIDRLAGDKPRIVVLNRTDLADPKATARWRAAFQRHGMTVLETDSRSGKGVNGFSGAVRTALHDKIEAYAAKGQVGRAMRVMVLGIPNVGKSTFINKVARRKAAAAGDRPGVTRGKQWITVDQGLELLDTPVSSGRALTVRRSASCWPSPVRSRPRCSTARRWRQTSCSGLRGIIPMPWSSAISSGRTPRAMASSCWSRRRKSAAFSSPAGNMTLSAWRAFCSMNTAAASSAASRLRCRRRKHDAGRFVDTGGRALHPRHAAALRRG